MVNTLFPQVVIIDIRRELSEFMGVFKPGERPDLNDIVFIEEVLTTIGISFIDFVNYRNILFNSMELFANGGIRYSDCESIDLLLRSVLQFSDNIIAKLMENKVYIDGFFPYTFKQLTLDHAIIFEYDAGLIGDRYIDPNKIYPNRDTSQWKW